MILKINIEDNKSSILLTPILWKCEKFAYGNLIPKFEKLCNVSFKFPKYYYGDEDIILLEDLKAKGYYLADKKTGVDLEQAFVVMDVRIILIYILLQKSTFAKL